MKKKGLIISFLCLVIALSSFVFFGCNVDTAANSTYTIYNTLYENIEKDNLSISADCKLNDFYSKTQYGATQNDSTSLNKLVEAGLKYIKTYYPSIKTSKDVNFDAVKISGRNLSSAYQELNSEYRVLKNMDNSQTSYLIYNAYFSAYRDDVITFVNQVYDTANKLCTLVNEANVDGHLGTEEQTVEDVKFYADSEQLKIFTDFKNLFIGNCKGRDLTNSMYQKYFSAFNSFEVAFTEKVVQNIKAEDMKMLFTALNGERNDFNKSLDKFSIYDFEKYDNSIDKYVVDNKGADIYYSKLNTYASYLNIVQQFIVNNIFA